MGAKTADELLSLIETELRDAYPNLVNEPPDETVPAAVRAHARAMHKLLNDLVIASRIAYRVIERHRLDALDQNPLGFRDLLFHAITKADGEMKNTPPAQQNPRDVVARIIDGMACRYWEDLPEAERHETKHPGHNLLLHEREKALRKAEKVLEALSLTTAPVDNAETQPTTSG